MRTIDANRLPRWPTLLLGLLLASCLASSALSAPRRTLRVPVTTWDQLEPYIRANIVPFTRDGDLEVFACQGVQDTSVVQPFDEPTSAFAKVLILQSLPRDRVLQEALVEFTAAFREETALWRDKDQPALRGAFWERLASAPGVYPRLRVHFEKAARRGQLRCWICEKNEAFAPPGLRELETPTEDSWPPARAGRPGPSPQAE